MRKVFALLAFVCCYLVIICSINKYFLIDKINKLEMSNIAKGPVVIGSNLGINNLNGQFPVDGQLIIDTYYKLKALTELQKKEFIISLDPSLFSVGTVTQLYIDDYARFIPFFDREGIIERIKLNQLDKNLYYSIFKYVFGFPIKMSREIVMLYKDITGDRLLSFSEFKPKSVSVKDFKFDHQMIHYFWLLCEVIKDSNGVLTVHYFDPSLATNREVNRTLKVLLEQVELAQKEYPNHLIINKIVKSEHFTTRYN